MEKYSIFSGLKGFEICNLLYKNQNIPNVIFIQNGKIGEILQMGSEIIFDIVSQDLWLDMRVECMEISLVITFEIKVDKKMSCGQLKRTLLDMINQILRAKNVLFMYEENDIKLIKGGQTEEIVIVKDSRSSSFDRKYMPKKLFELDDFMFIQSQFDYLDRFMICTLGKHLMDKAKESFERRLTINVATNTLVTNVLNTVKEVMPCRGIKIESFNFNKNIELKVHTESAKNPIEKSCCKCRIF